MEKFKGKYRVESARLQNWDYGANGLYFITICTANRECYFGDVLVDTTNGNVDDAVETPKLCVSITPTTPIMQLSEIGKMAHHFWTEIPNHFPFVELGEFVVMPNHIHGIIIINKPDDNRMNGGVNADGDGETATPTIPSATAATVNPKRQQTINASKKWNPNTLGVIINQYKRMVTIHARRIHAEYAWQERFHDHIIRNSAEYLRVSNYIINNPPKWAADIFFKSNSGGNA